MKPGKRSKRPSHQDYNNRATRNGWDGHSKKKGKNHRPGTPHPHA
jgi:hypothetical protein